jgi:hypothetical protein
VPLIARHDEGQPKQSAPNAATRPNCSS